MVLTPDEDPGPLTALSLFLVLWACAPNGLSEFSSEVMTDGDSSLIIPTGSHFVSDEE